MNKVLLLVASAFALASCAEESQDLIHQGAVAPPAVHWGYEGPEAPEHWADLSEEFALCRDGTEQSPIDLSGSVPLTDTGLERRLNEAVLTGKQRAHVMDIVDNGHTIQVTNDVPMTVELGNTIYELVQFHFHAPSEHTINGRHSPLEIHFVHKSAADELAVLGVLVEEGEQSAILEPIMSALPAGPGEQRRLDDLDLDMNELRPLPRRYYRYRGSLTTPPCSENVEWIVFADKREISTEQMTEIVSHLHNNNRPIQSLGARQLGFISGDASR